MRIKVLLIALLTLIVAEGSTARLPGEIVTRNLEGPSRVLVLDGSPVHDAGQLQLHQANWGMFGSWPGSAYPFSDAPSAQWPADSGVEYLFGGGLWVGAVVNGVPAVSEAMYLFEFRPTSDPIDIVYRSVEGSDGGNRLPFPDADDDDDGAIDEDPLDGRDNDGDGEIDEDYAAISDQMFSCWYTDDQPGIQDTFPEHEPLHILVRERSYQWSHPDYDDFVGIDYEITNTGDQVLQDVYVGIFFDPDAGRRRVNEYWTDDGTGFAAVPMAGGGTYDFGYGFDRDGDGGTVTGSFGVVILDHPTDPGGASAPEAVGATAYIPFAVDEPGAALLTNDFERYEAMSYGAVKADPVVPRDVQILMSVGPFAELAPGETIPFTVALVATPNDGTFANVINAATVYEGEFFDVDGDPGTGADGKEYQAHWWLPGQTPPPPPTPTVTADVRCTPRTLNLRAENASLRAHVTLPAGYHSSDVDASSLRLNGSVPGALATIVNDRKFIAEFPRKAMSQLATGEVAIEVTWMAAGASFAAGDHIRIIGGDSPDLAAADPGALRMSNSPNPFNPTTRISFDLPAASEVTLDVYSADGRRVRRLASGSFPAGTHGVLWQGRDDTGNTVASGIYFYRLRAGRDVLTRKMVLIK